MGIESDRVVFDYLSRVGDLAQQQQLPSGDRMRLVTRLRAEIEQQRAGAADTPAAVKRILGKLGTPTEVVDAARGTSGDGTGGTPTGASGGTVGEVPDASPGPSPAPSPAPPSGPVRKPAGARERLSGFTQRVGRAPRVPVPRQESAPAADAVPAPPHLAGEGELGPRDAVPDWWRVEPGPFGSPGASVPGFTGGIEIPEILEPPPRDRAPEGAGKGAKAAKGTKAAEGDGPAEVVEGAAPAGPGLLRRVLSRRRGDAVARGPLSPLLLTAAALLVAGAALGSLVPLALGWLIAYGTRKLSRTEAKLAALGLPGLVAASAGVWLWGRVDGRWGEPIPQGGMGAALVETWPVALRAAAVASALFLVWRARRRPGG
ncbi:hypothetical protein [Streptomyces sp. 8N706]|uniref:hypothetical protein n=1 Tax=Streptomyces sp. 8N706 TaxID=3457416 RepID=UPI003FD0AB4B